MIDIRHANPEEAKLRKQWQAKPESYMKPSAPTPEQPRKSGLLCSSLTNVSLGYILFKNGQLKCCEGGGAQEFLKDDPDSNRRGTLSAKSKPGFHVYYKHGAYWYGVPKHFLSLVEALPYLQGGNRVIVEYQFSI